ncbi:hypothetical protein AQUCO_05300102v1 [Aquilegia coerulea]|uniref:Nudix hydrolase domain-containing protein n=1 Tax=Aquilegia coerulea TaxID=218851 RepID=A0A2G5CJN0_AQUCA|nr:hypothetical protein AQUCO_05300102v1 [Aquilegia coerulea]PIA31037.1 hypothetical protein AQUCO_05300102v1 [Aquilegia coerulea]PIA31038.1 hypothetical protein AQUCO_05300102v1 [Aquilegia coerulea]
MITITDNIFLEETKPSHYVTIFVRTAMRDPLQTPQNLEPNKCDGWDWYELNDLPKMLFSPLEKMVYNGFNLFQWNEER